MATSIYMIVTDQSGAVLVGETQQPIVNPFTKTTVKTPVEVADLAGQTEIPLNIGSQGGGTGAGKVVFDPWTVSRRPDKLSETFFLAHASGIAWRFVDFLIVQQTGQSPGPSLQPHLSYRLGTVGISQIVTSADGDSVVERASFVFGQLQIGYQVQNADGTLGAFAPVGWDRVRNVKI